MTRMLTVLSAMFLLGLVSCNSEKGQQYQSRDPEINSKEDNQKPSSTVTDGEDQGGNVETPPSPSGSSTFPDVSDYKEPGPFETEYLENQGPDGGYTIAKPKDLGENGVKHPIINWGNATFTTPGIYKALLTHFASHGFVVIASNSTMTGQGETIISGLDFLEEENQNSSSPYFEKLDVQNSGVIGHSQGGASAVVVAGADDRIKASIPIMPDCNFWVKCNNVADIDDPMLLIAGGSDPLVAHRTVESKVYDGLKSEVVYGVVEGLDHMSWMKSVVDQFGEATTAWFRAHLMSDSTAKEKFYGSDCEICTSSNWETKTKNM